MIILSEVRQRRNLIWHPFYVESKRKWYKWTYLQNRKRLKRLREWTCVCQGDKGGGEGIVRQFGMDMHTLLYLKWITDCIAHGMLLNVMWQPGWEGSLGENGECAQIHFIHFSRNMTLYFIIWLYPTFYYQYLLREYCYLCILYKHIINSK